MGRGQGMTAELRGGVRPAEGRPLLGSGGPPSAAISSFEQVDACPAPFSN